MFNSHPAFVSLEIQAINIFCRLWVSTLKLNGCRVMRIKLRIILRREGKAVSPATDKLGKETNKGHKGEEVLERHGPPQPAGTQAYRRRYIYK